jgi:hypothetical protein
MGTSLGSLAPDGRGGRRHKERGENQATIDSVHHKFLSADSRLQ